jgi:hypothetical protein
MPVGYSMQHVCEFVRRHSVCYPSGKAGGGGSRCRGGAGSRGADRRGRRSRRHAGGRQGAGCRGCCRRCVNRGCSRRKAHPGAWGFPQHCHMKLLHSCSRPVNGRRFADQASSWDVSYCCQRKFSLPMWMQVWVYIAIDIQSCIQTSKPHLGVLRIRLAWMMQQQQQQQQPMQHRMAQPSRRAQMP